MSANGKAPTYAPPEALLGDHVYWFPGGDLAERPQPAVVTEVGREALSLAVFQPMVDRLVVRDGVRHADDPRPRLDEVFHAGSWCHREDYLARSEVTDQAKAAVGSHAAAKAVREKGRREAAEAKKQPAAASA